MDPTNTREAVKEYYGQILASTSDLKTSACLLGDVSADTAKLLRNVHPVVKDRFYGCGSPLPPLMRGLTVLDIGCGTGRDVFVAAQLVGEGGTVIGLDMTPEQLDYARNYEAWHAAKFGFAQPNTQFVLGNMEDLMAAGIADNSIDLVISNCVLNLAASKEAVFLEIWRVLKPGGELYFSDVYASKRIPPALQRDKVLWGECLSGALYKGDLGRIMKKVGFKQHWTISSRAIDVGNEDVKAQVGAIAFSSETIRAFKLPELEDGREDYGQMAKYNGSIPSFPHAYMLGIGSTFITDQLTPVDGNTARVLTNTRYATAFNVTLAMDHKGTFRGELNCASLLASNGGESGSGSGQGTSSHDCCH